MFDISVFREDQLQASAIATKPDIYEAARFALSLADELGRQTSETTEAARSVLISCDGDVFLSIRVIAGGLLAK